MKAGGGVPRAGGQLAGEEILPDVSEVARQNLKRAANACRRYGWLSFWVQLVMTTIATVILLFSMAFTSQAGGASAGAPGPSRGVHAGGGSRGRGWQQWCSWDQGGSGLGRAASGPCRQRGRPAPSPSPAAAAADWARRLAVPHPLWHCAGLPLHLLVIWLHPALQQAALLPSGQQPGRCPEGQTQRRDQHAGEGGGCHSWERWKPSGTVAAMGHAMSSV